MIYLAGAEPNYVTYPVLLSILRANGLAAFESEGRVNIVPDDQIRFYPTRVVQATTRPSRPMKGHARRDRQQHRSAVPDPDSAPHVAASGALGSQCDH